jgi:hypothetical protein
MQSIAPFKSSRNRVSADLRVVTCVKHADNKALARVQPLRRLETLVSASASEWAFPGTPTSGRRVYSDPFKDQRSGRFSRPMQRIGKTPEDKISKTASRNE